MAQISTRQLAQLCRRAATSLAAGVDTRQVWQKEADRGGYTQRFYLGEVSRRVAVGDGLADALHDCHGYFPPLVCEMVEVGERTGKVDAVLFQLADHYDHLLQLRRNFLYAIAWPAIQLAAAVMIVGLLIWIMGIVGEMAGGESVDILGFGLVGTTGLAIYLCLVTAIAGAIGGFIWAISRGWLWTGPLMRLVLHVPLLGSCLKNLALSRMAWSLGMAIDAGMDVRPSVALALKSAQNSFYAGLASQIDGSLAGRTEIHQALRETRSFPEEFLDTLETGEQTGLVTETMLRLSKEYRERAQGALNLLTMLAGFACWGLVAVVIIAIIFRLAFFYLGTINSLLDDIGPH